MTNFKKGELAKKNYQSVKYFPFNNDPASSYVLTANPFSFLMSWLDNEIYDMKRETKNKRRSRLEKARYFCALAEDFNTSATNSRMPTKATLLYYAHLNLVKCFLLVNDVELETTLEHHGLGLPHDLEFELKIGNKPKQGISIFKEFASLTGVDFDSVAGTNVEINELLFELPEIHELGFAIDIFSGKRKILPVEIEIKTNEKRSKLFYEIVYEKKNENIMTVERFEQSILKQHLQLQVTDDTANIRFRSINKFNFKHQSHASWCNAYHKICKEIQSLGVVTLLTNSGYRYYLNLKPAKLNRYCSFYAMLFYTGTVARYRPSLNELVLKGIFQAIINEAIETCPNQFYYHLVGLTTKRVCAKPMAKI